MGLDMIFYVYHLRASVFPYYIAAIEYGRHSGILFFPGKNYAFDFISLQGMIVIFEPDIIRPDFPLDIKSCNHIHRHVIHT